MELIFIIGPQAVGKMTIGQEIEKRRDSKLLFNHQTIDLFANYLGYSQEAFRLSNETRLSLFRAFTESSTNITNGIIFTVVVDFSREEDMLYLEEISGLFTKVGGKVYFVELEATIEKRLERNVGENRLKMKPSKRNIEFSRKEILMSDEKYRLNSFPGEMEERFPDIPYIKIVNNDLSAVETVEKILNFLD